MEHKYKTLINNIPNCPPASTINQDLESFRFVFADINCEKNFLPPFVQRPRRANSKNDYEKCDGYALSFFTTLEKAQRFYNYLQKSSSNIHKSLGSCIATGILYKTDGSMTKIQKNGHFSLHEFQGVDLRNRFNIVGEVNGTD